MRYLPLLSVVLWLAACSYGEDRKTLTVYAAASLTDAFIEAAEAFEAQHEGVDVILNFAGSSTLATQIIEGAEADVFASANPDQMQNVHDGGLISDEPLTLAYNQLALVVPQSNPAGITTLTDLAQPGIKLVVAGEGVPVRGYTNTMLDRLADNPQYGESYRRAVLDNVISEEDDVRQVLVKVLLGEADAGFVYTSDVTDDIITIPIPADYNTRARYPIAVLDDSPNDTTAETFVTFMRGETGQRIIERWGLTPITMGD